MANQQKGTNKPGSNDLTFSQKIVNGLNKTKNVLGAANSVGKEIANLTNSARMVAETVARVIKIVKGRNNPQWYLRYGTIKPSVNELRSMDPTFNTLFSKNPTLGVCKQVEVDLDWIGYANTYAMNRIAFKVMQAVRSKLKSNLPYDLNSFTAFLIQGIALAVIAKQLERDIHWNQHTENADAHFSELFTSRSADYGKNGRINLITPEYLLKENWADTVTYYNTFADLYNEIVTLPPAIGEFISHYFGSVFTAGTDAHNDTLIINCIRNIDWCEVDPNDKTKLIFSTKSIVAMNIAEFCDLINKYSRNFAVIIADMKPVVSLNPCRITPYEQYTYYKMYDKSYLQGLLNGYTGKPTSDDWIRLDKFSEEDPFTQFLFLGGVNPDTNDYSRMGTLRILNMTYKFYSTPELEWPISLFTASSSGGNISIDGAFGLSLTSIFTEKSEMKVQLNSSGNQRIIELNAVEPTPTFTAATLEINLLPNVGKQDRSAPITTSYDRSGEIFRGIVGGLVARIKTAENKYFDYWLVRDVDFRQGGFHSFNKVCVLKSSTAISLPQYYEYVIINGMHAGTLSDQAIANNIMVAFGYESVNSVGTVTQPDFNGLGVNIQSIVDGPYQSRIVTFIYEKYNSTGLTIKTTFSFANTNFVISNDNLNRLYPTQSAFANVAEVNNTIAKGSLSADNVSIDMMSDSESLLEYLIDLFDYHIPVYSITDATLTVSSNGQITKEMHYRSDAVLVKENYIPYMYNLRDLPSVLFSMYRSLLDIPIKENNYAERRKFKSNNRRRKDKEKEKGSTSNYKDDKTNNAPSSTHNPTNNS